MVRVRGQRQDPVHGSQVSRVSHQARWVAPATVAALALVTSACGASASRSTGSPSTATVPLVVYAAEGYDSAVAKAFQQATGIPTSVYDAHTGLVVSKIEQEKNNPQWGLTWFDGDMAMASLDQQGLLLKGYEPNVAWNPHGLQFLPKDQSYIPTGYTIAATLLYNSSTVPTPPSSWNDLLGASYRGRVGILNPAIDGSAYPMMAGWAVQFGGVPQLESYVTAVVKNGAKVFSSPDDELNAIKQGSIDVAFAQSSYGIGVGETQSNLKLAYPQFVTPMPSIMGIDAKASPAVQAEAKRFVQFVLSPQGQQAMQGGDAHGDSLYWPVVNGVAPRPEVPSPATIPTRTVDPYTWGAQENSISQWFTSTVAR